MKITPKVIKLFREMAELTEPECATVCRAPHSCCSREYCEMAAEMAAAVGVALIPTGHPTLPFMGSHGCIVDPHLRPLCSLHTCAINGYGFKPNDPGWTKKYFKLREAIEREVSR